MIQTEIAKNGKKTLKWRNLYLISKYKPETDAQKLIMPYLQNGGIKDSLFIVFGEALGYIREALERGGAESSNIFVREANEETLSRLEHSNSQYITDDAELPSILENALIRRLKPVLIALESYKKAFDKEFSEFQRRFVESLRIANENIKVSSYFSKIWFVNYYRNLKTSLYRDNRFFIGRDLPKAGFKITVIMAGFSLNAVIETLRLQYQEHILLSVLSAARALIKNGITPDFVLFSDAGAANILHAFELPPSIPVLASVYANSALIAQLKNPIIFYDLPTELTNPSLQLKNPSVAMDAGFVAKRLCGNPPLFVGLDLAYSQCCGTHAHPNAVYQLRENRHNRLHNTMSVQTAFLGRLDILTLGKSLYTTKGFMMVRDAVNTAFKGAEIISEGIDFADIRRIDTLIGNGSHFNRAAVLEEISRSFIGVDSLHTEIRSVLDMMLAGLDNPDAFWCERVFLREKLMGVDERAYASYFRKKLESIR